MTFDTVRSLGNWVPIRDCPGRFVLRDIPPTTSIAELLGPETKAQSSQSPKARDLVWVASFDDGGVISYQRSDQTWIHTLCTLEGFKRKLTQLKITVPEPVTET